MLNEPKKLHVCCPRDLAKVNMGKPSHLSSCQCDILAIQSQFFVTKFAL